MFIGAQYEEHRSDATQIRSYFKWRRRERNQTGAAAECRAAALNVV